MTITLSTIANTAIDQMFRGLDGVLEKAAAAAKAKEVEDSVYLNWRMAPDMLSLVRQVHIATEIPARALSRLAGAELPSFADDEATFAELRARVSKAQAFIKDLSAEAMDADPDGSITFPAGRDKEMTLPRSAYVQNVVLPNLYFHVTAAYIIMRHLGVDIGKTDFLAVPKV
jgi:uncharacterized protein